MVAPQYTTCVQPQDYKDPNLPGGGFLVGLGQVIIGGGLDVLLKVCAYLLHGKLVCLGGDRCAIGRLASFETVDDKSGFEKLDNDFSLNIVLCPDPLGGIQRGEAHRMDNYNLAKNSKQGWLITERPNMPSPLEAAADHQPSPRFVGTFVDFDTNSFGPPVVYPTAGDEPYKVPVFHCEIEGDRTAVVCAMANALWGPISNTVCSFNPFGIPIGKLVCFLISLPLALAFAPLLAAAWAAGSNDNRSFAGDLAKGDLVLIRGRWVYDAGHAGWNELHAVKHVQKLNTPSDCDWAGFDDVYKRWCDRVSETPPHTPAGGAKPAGMTPEQTAVYDAQARPENRWILHPAVDGCTPGEPEPEPPH
jgi:hypothetical protein